MLINRGTTGHEHALQILNACLSTVVSVDWYALVYNIVSFELGAYLILLPITLTQGPLFELQSPVYHSPHMCEANLFAELSIVRYNNDGTILSAPAA